MERLAFIKDNAPEFMKDLVGKQFKVTGLSDDYVVIELSDESFTVPKECCILQEMKS